VDEEEGEEEGEEGEEGMEVGSPWRAAPEGVAAALGHEPPRSSPWQKGRRPRPRTAPTRRRRPTPGRGSGRRRAAPTALSRLTGQGEGGPGRRPQNHAAPKPNTRATPKRDNWRLSDNHEHPSPGPGHPPPSQATQPAPPDAFHAPRSVRALLVEGVPGGALQLLASDGVYDSADPAVLVRLRELNPEAEGPGMEGCPCPRTAPTS